jgi:hypothetical protein
MASVSLLATILVKTTFTGLILIICKRSNNQFRFRGFPFQFIYKALYGLPHGLKSYLYFIRKMRRTVDPKSDRFGGYLGDKGLRRRADSRLIRR